MQAWSVSCKEMQETGFNKITEAVQQKQGWLKDKLKVVDGVAYTNAADWLAANRTHVETALGLTRTETSGTAYQHLRDLVENVFLGHPITTKKSAESQIKWGVTAQTESDIDTEVLTLQAKIDLLRPLLQQHSSLGAACVPTSYAYLQVLGEKLRNPELQRTRLQGILTRWQREFHSQFVLGSTFVDSNSGKETVPRVDSESHHTGLSGLDTILSFWAKPEGNTVWGKTSLDVPSLVAGKPENRLAIITTMAGLTGKVIAVESTNPFWSQKDVEKPPRIGDSYTCAGVHALLVIDCQPDKNDKSFSARILTLVDPQTGTVFQLTAEAIYRANERKFQSVGNAALATSVWCGTCWVG